MNASFLFSMYDCIIIGSGPAALSAAVFLGRAKCSVLVLGNSQESNLMKAKSIGNYLGLDGISGKKLMMKSILQAKKYGSKILVSEVVDLQEKFSAVNNKKVTIDKKIQKNMLMKDGEKKQKKQKKQEKQEEQGKIFSVKTADNAVYEGKTVIIAVGLQYQASGVQNEKTFVGKGVHYCVSCDGYFYKNKKVAVIGNGNYAAEEALELLTYTKNITIISQEKKMIIHSDFLKKLKKAHVQFSNKKVVSFIGSKMLEGVRYKSISSQDSSYQNLSSKNRSSQTPSSEKFDGIFIAIGTAGALTFANKLGLMMNGEYLVVDKDKKTNLEGVYAVGGSIEGSYQIAKSVGDGCSAAIQIIKKVKGISQYSDLT